MIHKEVRNNSHSLKYDKRTSHLETASPCYVVLWMKGQTLAGIKWSEVEKERGYLLSSRCTMMFHLIFKIYLPSGANKGIFHCMLTESFFIYEEHWLNSEWELFWIRWAEVISHCSSRGNYENTSGTGHSKYVFLITSHDISWN